MPCAAAKGRRSMYPATLALAPWSGVSVTSRSMLNPSWSSWRMHSNVVILLPANAIRVIRRSLQDEPHELERLRVVSRDLGASRAGQRTDELRVGVVTHGLGL